MSGTRQALSARKPRAARRPISHPRLGNLCRSTPAHPLLTCWPPNSIPTISVNEILPPGLERSATNLQSYLFDELLGRPWHIGVGLLKANLALTINPGPALSRCHYDGNKFADRDQPARYLASQQVAGTPGTQSIIRRRLLAPGLQAFDRCVPRDALPGVEATSPPLLNTRY